MIYEFQCPQCQFSFEEIYTLADIHYSFPTTQCPRCHSIARRLYSPPMMIMDLPPYYDAGLGRYIASRQDRTRAMKELGVTEVGSEKLDLKAIDRKKQRESDKKSEEIKTEALKLINHMEQT